MKKHQCCSMISSTSFNTHFDFITLVFVLVQVAGKKFVKGINNHITGCIIAFSSYMINIPCRSSFIYV